MGQEMNLHRGKIGNRLVVTFISFVTLIIGLSGWLLYRSARRNLDDELGTKLIAIAQTVAVQIDPGVLLRLEPGYEESRTYRNILRKLQRTKDATDVRKLYIFDSQNRGIVDSDPNVPIGYEYVRLKSDLRELRSVWSGKAAHSVLFKGNDGRFYKTGYAPLIDDQGKTVAVVAVQTGAAFVRTIENFKRNVIMFGTIALALAIVIGLFLSRTITDPIDSLVEAARRIGSGDMETPVQVESRDEVGYLALSMDRMRKDVTERDNRLKMMLSAVAHEIRNPLGGIEIFASLIQDELESGSQEQENAKKIIKESRNLDRIITEFLDFARPSEPQKSSVSLKSLIDEAYSLVSTEIENKKIDFKTQLNDGEVNVYVDPEQIKRALINVFKNAVQAMPKGGCLTVRDGETTPREIESNVDSVGKLASVLVEDTGPGIPEKDIDRLFEPFFTTKEKGVGLRLSIVKKTIQDNGGSIEAQTGSKGAIFRIDLPLSKRS